MRTGSSSGITSGRAQKNSVTPAAEAYAEHFGTRYGPTLAAHANADKNGRVEELDAALMSLYEEWNRGEPGDARFEMEYLLAVGSRAEA